MSGPRRWGLAAALLVAAGCPNEIVPPVAPPTWSASAAARIVAHRTFDGQVSAWVLAPEQGWVAAPPGASVGDRWLALTFDRPADELGLEPGPLPLARSDDPGRPLPAPAEVLATQVFADGAAPWAEADTDHPVFVAARRPSLDVDVCLDAGGCFARVEDVAPRVCTPGCPLRASTRPAASPAGLAEVDARPCPPGWAEVAGPSGITCDPPADAACPPGEARFPSASGCAPIGSACPETPDGFAPDLPSDRPVRYVRLGAQGGDGSRDAPYGTIDAAMLEPPPPSAVLALSPGAYVTTVVSGAGVTLWGACPRDTVVVARSGLVLQLLGGPGGLRNLSVLGPEPALEVIGSEAEGRLDAVWIRGVQGRPAVVARSGGVVGRRVVVEAGEGPGLEALAGGRIELEQVILRGHTGWSVRARDPDARVALSDAILTAASVPDRNDGAALARDGASVRLRGARVDGFRAWGVQADGGRVELLQVRLQNVAGPGARGVHVVRGATADLSGLWISDVAGPGIEVGDAELTADAVFSRAPVRLAGAKTLWARTAVQVGDAVAMDVRGAGSQLTARDVRLRGGAVGLRVAGDAAVDVSRLSVADVTERGVHLPGGRGRLEDVDSAGLVFEGGGPWSVHRVALDAPGLALSDGVEVEVEDLHVTAAAPGVRVDAGATLVLQRGELTGSLGAGLCVDAAVARVTDLEVRRTSAGPACLGTADAVAVTAGGALVLDRYRLVEGADAGLRVDTSTRARAANGRVEGFGIGVVVPEAVPLSAVLEQTTIEAGAAVRVAP